MAVNKISGGSNIAAAVMLSLAAGEYFMLPAGQGIIGQYGSVLAPQLAAGNPLTGQYLVDLGLYSCLQVYDQGLQYWKTVCTASPNHNPNGIFSADGYNFRLANTTGCPVGAIITAAGSTGTNGFYGYTQFGVGQGTAVTIQNGIATAGNTVFTITPSAGGSLWNAIVGGAINTTISFSGTLYQNGPFGGTGTSVTGAAGTNYSKPPTIVFFPPPNQGAQPYLLPTAVCTISGGAINAVTVINQGMGLLGLPGIVVIPQPGDTTGGGAVLGWTAGNSAQVGSGTVLGMWPAYYGTAVTAPVTFTYGGTSNPAPTATAIMNFSITSITNTTPGSGYTNAYAVWQGGVITSGITAANTNPVLDKYLEPYPLFPPVTVVASTGVTTLAGGYGGSGMAMAPTLAFGTQLAAGTVTTVAVQTPVVGGNSDTVQLFSI
jgi:hypothetical protein